MPSKTTDHHHDDHTEPHDHEHDHDDDHDHPSGSGVWGWLGRIFHVHGHSHEQSSLTYEQGVMDNAEAIRTVWWALAALGSTTLLQIAIFWLSGSVALLADTLHNVGDSLNSIPLLIAFYLARRTATRRYTYGFARAEDVAGIVIVFSIAFSAGLIFWESFQKLRNPEPMVDLPWVAAAAVIGFLGNEAVAWLQIRVGRKIGSAAMVADGLHARTDGFTSLAVLIAVGGTWLGYPVVDPIIGLLIGVAIVFITWDATRSMWYRLMDAVEPALLDKAEHVIHHQEGVKELRRLRMRWVGHRLHAEVLIAVDPQLPTVQSHAIAEAVRHALFHEIPRLAEIIVHVEPWSERPEEHHSVTLHHEPAPSPIVG